MSALAGCVDTVFHDEPSAPRNVVSHCQGSENVDASSVAAIPIPVVAFFSPHADLRNLKPEDYLNRCGPTTELANRDVVLDKSACIPASFTEILTLGIWQWCPASVTWSADVTNGPSPSQVSQAVIGLPAPQTTASYWVPNFSGTTFHGCRRNQRSGPVSGSNGRGGVERGEGAAKHWCEPRSTLALGFLTYTCARSTGEIGGHSTR
jgi:hypothetical protein